MQTPKSSISESAIILSRHPRDDFRTEEAKRFTQWIVNFTKEFILPGNLLIDLGCAGGKQTFQAEALGARVIGLDYSREALQWASTVGKDIGSNASFIRGNYFVIPLVKDSVDVVLYPKNLVEISYSEAEGLAIEIFRVLVPGGKLILTLPDCMMKYTAYGVKDKVLSNYDVRSGSSTIKTTIPGQGEFEGISFFWTCGYAIHLFSRFLKLVYFAQIENYIYLMVFAKALDASN